MIGASVMVGAGIIMKFYSAEEALHTVDFETLGLLLGMMILVRLLQQTGFFQYAAIVTAKKSRGNVWFLLVFLGATTSILSMFLDNVTTVVLIAPVTILIAEMLNISAFPLLMAEAMLSNIGGVATLVGDPPNVIIGTVTKFTFLEFLTHMAPMSIVAWFVTLIIFRIMFHKEISVKPKNIKALMSLDEKKAFKDPQNAKKILTVLGFVIIFFFLQGLLHLTPAYIALAGASLALLIVRPPMEETISHVEWNVLLFFASLFICVGGLKFSGVLELFSSGIIGLARENLLLANMLLLWVSAIASGIIDNIPFTIAMVPVIQKLGEMGICVSSLWWALALGVGLGGNATPIGSTANVIIVSLSEKTKKPITFNLWLRTGIPVMIFTCFFISLLFILFFKWMNTP
jgi:Na+/H+ antiporter NhaD/arsenite permease-like protein